MIQADPRYEGFLRRYAHDPIAFTVEVCGVRVPPSIERRLSSLNEPDSPAALPMLEGDAELPLLASIALWFLLTRANSNTYLTARTRRRVEQGLLLAIKCLIPAITNGKSADAWVATHLVMTNTNVYVIGYRHTWFIAIRTAPPSSPENLAGTYGPYLLWIIDGAHLMSLRCLQVIQASLMHECSRLVLTWPLAADCSLETLIDDLRARESPTSSAEQTP